MFGLILARPSEAWKVDFPLTTQYVNYYESHTSASHADYLTHKIGAHSHHAIGTKIIYGFFLSSKNQIDAAKARSTLPTR
jgi:hypothetical protein